MFGAQAKHFFPCPSCYCSTLIPDLSFDPFSLSTQTTPTKFECKGRVSVFERAKSQRNKRYRILLFGNFYGKNVVLVYTSQWLLSYGRFFIYWQVVTEHRKLNQSPKYKKKHMRRKRKSKRFLHKQKNSSYSQSKEEKQTFFWLFVVTLSQTILLLNVKRLESYMLFLFSIDVFDFLCLFFYGHFSSTNLFQIRFPGSVYLCVCAYIVTVEIEDIL